MPITHLLHPRTQKVLGFEEAPAILEQDGLMPKAAVELVIRDIGAEAGQTHVRPSDLPMHLTCRRKKVWEASNDYGVDPRELWPMLEGTAIHKALATTELKIPGDGKRVEVCGVPIRGQIDLIEGDTIVDYKTKSAFYITRYGVKGSGTKPWVDIWEPEEENSIGDFVDQLSIYGVILRKGLDIHTNYGKVHRIYRGVKPDKGAFRTFLFTLLTEEELENKIGPWLRSLAVGLTTATNNSNAWKDMPPDGRGFISSRGAMWMCDKCQLKEACFSKDSLDVF